MKELVIKYLRLLFPFIITIALWRISVPWINPAGILAIIPIFYCSFIRPVSYFTPFAILICFLIDYKFNTVLMWTTCYCAFYAVMNIQTFIDLTHTNKSGVYAFMGFVGAVIFLMTATNLSLMNLLSGAIMFAVLTIMYIPVITTVQVVQND